MKKTYEEYYEYSPAVLASMWRRCFFVFDTNILLNLYELSDDSRDEFYNVLTQIEGRVWLPYHVGYEYHNGRLRVIFDQLTELNKFEESISSHYKSERIQLIAERTKKALNELVKDEKRSFPDYAKSDPILAKLSEAFDGCIGEPYSESEIEELKKEGKRRYDLRIPPGFADKDKGEKNKYGDFIMWQQIIDFAKDNKKPMILITDEKKADWWWKPKPDEGDEDVLVGPRPELKKEFLLQTKQRFYMYRMRAFLENASKKLKVRIQDRTFAEIDEIERRVEARIPIAPSEKLFTLLEEALDALPVRDKRIIQLLFGLLDGVERSPEEVGRVFGISTEEVLERRDSAFARLRHPTRL